jgi:DNA-binding NtrC family response regulator
MSNLALINDNHPQIECETLPDNVIIGNSEAAKSLRQMVALAAGTDSALYLSGPSGSGKEVAARAVHATSARREYPFVKVYTSNLTPETAAAILCGTNQNGDDGLIARAQGGTLFIDELADLSSDVQAILLRLLECSEVLPYGAHFAVQANVRILAASTQSLPILIGEGQFRQDLYYQLSSLSIPVPPLRLRKEDIGLLIDYFLLEKPMKRRFTIENEAMKLLQAQYWPGNIRELRNLVSRAFLFHPGQRIGVRRMDALISMGQPNSIKPRHKKATQDVICIEEGFCLKSFLADEEKRYILSAIAQTKGVIQHAADLAGLKRTTFVEKMRRHGIKYKKLK